MSAIVPLDAHNSRELGTFAPATDVILITPGAGALASPIRAIRANGAGTVTVTTFAGNSRVLNFLAGETRNICATHVTAATATGLEGLV
jgi:hypothetical protein